MDGDAVTSDPREFFINIWCVGGGLTCELHESEESAISDYDHPSKGWLFDSCWHYSSGTDGQLQANPYDLQGASRDAERQRHEGMAEMREGPRYTMSARSRP